MRIGFLGLVLGIVGSVDHAFAGGLYLSEFNTPSQGVADAGSGAIAVDASTAIHNPAGMTRLKDHQLMVGGGIVGGRVRFNPDSDTAFGGGDGGDQLSPAPLLGAYYSHRISDRWRVGAALTSYSGSALDPNDGWAGRYQLQNVSLLTLSLVPSVAYQVTDWLSLGAGANLMYANLKYKVAVPLPGPSGDGQVEFDKIDDFNVGFNLGALVNAGDRTRVGLVYQSEVEQDLSGDIEFKRLDTLPTVDTTMVFPQAVRLSVVHELTDCVNLLGSTGWEDWSAFENQFVSVQGPGPGGSGNIPRNFDDTWFLSAGLQYAFSDRWMGQTGFKYDSSPVDAKDRTADLPVDEQYRFALGVQHEFSDTLDIGGTLTYAYLGRGRIESSSLRGEYRNNNLFFFSVNANFSGLWGSGA